MLTSIDKGCDGHMAGGEAVLRCFGHEIIPEATEAKAEVAEEVKDGSGM
jgi:hypothetical protein